MSQPYCYGGLKLLNIPLQEKSLKSSRMQKLFIKGTIDSNIYVRVNEFFFHQKYCRGQCHSYDVHNK